MQLLQTAEYLRHRGVCVTIDAAAPPERFDLVHFWGLSPMETLYPAFSRAAFSGRPVVLSPIYWNLGRYYAAMGSVQRLGLWNGQRPLRRKMAVLSARIFISGEKEARALEEDAGMPLPWTAVPCGIDPELFGREPPGPAARRGVLCAARIGPRKNQLALARQCALRRLPLLLAGPAGNRAYLDRCLRFPGVEYAGPVPPGRLAALYRGARIHALAGYAETPGLAGLEAAACGCEIVATGEGTAREYFGAAASYCDPYDPGSVGAAIDSALEGAHQPELRESVLARFSWETCLEPLAEVYQSLI
ncbi:MAG: glycosyltransferase [Oscillibacter sp.]|nr:glycosyltransferase [Oscillibacter sp.]